MYKPELEIIPFGQRALLLNFPKDVSEDYLSVLLQFEKLLIEKLEGEWEMVVAYHSITLNTYTTIDDMRGLVSDVKSWYEEFTPSPQKTTKTWRLPVLYDTDLALDFKEVCEQTRLSTKDLKNLHTTNVYTIYGIGFLPGFMYLGGLNPRLEIPRRDHPRMVVPQGAVGLAGQQTGIYPQESPGGWNIIGNCPVPIFRVEKEPHVFVAVGDRVQFYEINKSTFDLIRVQQEVGIYQPECKEE